MQANFSRLTTPELIEEIGHETWHAHQLETIAEWLDEHQGIVDLDSVDPHEPANIGAVYAINTIIYTTMNDDPRLYRIQAIEREANLVKHKIHTLLT